MFDIGFGELLLIAVVALVVLGPERLPKAARLAGLWVRRARAQWYSVKSELERELEAEELKRSMQETQAALKQAQTRLQDEFGQAKARVQDELGKAQTRVQDEIGQAKALMRDEAGAADRPPEEVRPRIEDRSPNAPEGQVQDGNPPAEGDDEPRRP
jgi:sec-independent protein translocase protein TatB